LTSPPAAAADFLALVRERERGKLKVYVGSAAGVGKSFRMLQEAHDLRRRGVDVVIGFIETHGRADTAAQQGDLEVVPRRAMDYRGVRLEEMDVDGILARRPQLAIVDELAHSNVPGSTRAKRWEDVIVLLDAGVNVISAVNIQHLESLNDVVARVLGVTVRETVPDWVLGLADQVVNVDISAEDLRQRLQEGKIYPPEKIVSALANFFTEANLTTLRELALREVASSVDLAREEFARREEGPAARVTTVSRIMVAMASSTPNNAALLRKASRIAGRLNTDWYCVYVRTPDEDATRIDSDIQRRLVANIQLAQGMGAEVVTVEGTDIAATLCSFAVEHGVGLIIAGQSQRPVWRRILRRSVVETLVLNRFGLDVMVVPMGAKGDKQ
jgi:two-component system sensor histidine kinase KdpD